MAQLIVRNIEEDVKSGLQRRAKSHGHSVEQEVREILRSAVKASNVGAVRLGTRISKRFKAVGLDREIMEFHGYRARAASFRK